MKHVFIIGSKGIPAAYGGFETFVENLTGQADRQSVKTFSTMWRACLIIMKNLLIIMRNASG